MPRFGFGSKSNDDDEDSNRTGLFGRKKSSPNPRNDNPYAQEPANDPYANAPPMTPYQQARAGLARQGGPGGYPGGPAAGLPGGPASGLPSGPPRGPGGPGGPGGPPPPYTTQQRPGAGYGNDSYGAPAGYGANRYDSGGGAYGGAGRPGPGTGGYAGEKSATSSDSYGSGPRGGLRPGGYGGLSRVDSRSTDVLRDDLLAGAKDRVTQQQQQYGQPASSSGGTPGSTTPSGGESFDGYGAPRELTEEEQAQQEERAYAQQIREERKATKGTLMRTLNIVNQTNETGRGTLARLGEQHERINRAEMNLDKANTQNKIAQERTAELKRLNRSMFAVHVSNPFTAKERQAALEQAVIDEHRGERSQREATRKDEFKSTQRMEGYFRDYDRASRDNRPTQLGADKAAARSKFMFHDDDPDMAAEDEQDEDEIDHMQDQMLVGVKQLNVLAKAIGSELDESNSQLDRVMAKTDLVDDGVRMNRHKLQVIEKRG